MQYQQGKKVTYKMGVWYRNIYFNIVHNDVTSASNILTYLVKWNKYFYRFIRTLSTVNVDPIDIMW